MTRHESFQRQFHAALRDESSRFPPAQSVAFAVYRNTGLRACIDALAQNYPAVECLVGSEWFRAAAAAYATDHPPRDARMILYGDGFADFLADAPAARELTYLGDVARLDRLWTEAYVAADAPILTAERLAADASASLGQRCLLLHPALRSFVSADPVFSIWAASRAGESVDPSLTWGGQEVLISRPRLDVHVTQVDSPTLAFITSCAGGLSLAECAQAVMQGHPDARLDHLFSRLLTLGAFVDI